LGFVVRSVRQRETPATPLKRSCEAAKEQLYDHGARPNLRAT